MAVVVWARILGGDLVPTTETLVAEANAELDGADRVGLGIDWQAAGKRAGAAAGKAARAIGPAALLVIAEWLLDGLLLALGTDAGKPAAAALEKFGDAILTVMADVLRPLIPVLERVLDLIAPLAGVVLGIVGTLLGVALALAAEAIGELVRLAQKIQRGIEGIARDIGAVWATIHNALRRVQTFVDDLIAGVAGWVQDVLTFVLEWVLGPLEEHLANLSSLWDEWIGRHLPDFGELRTPYGYMWNDVWYEWGTGPLGEAPHSRVIEHPAAEAQLVAAVAAYSRANGGIARAMWGPA